MAEITYESIQALVETHEARGSTVYCTFRCAQTGTTVEGSAPIQKPTGIKGQAQGAVAQSVMYSVRRSIFGMLRQVLGHGAVGRLGTQLGSQAVEAAAQRVSHSKDQVQAAVVAAFKGVMGSFRWDEASGAWVAGASGDPSASGPATEITLGWTELTNHVLSAGDRAVLQRMVFEVALADGELSDDERQGPLLADLSDEELDALRARPALTAAELAQVTAGAPRLAMLAYAWAAALSDHELTNDERGRVATFSQGLQVSPEDAGRVRRLAQGYVFLEVLREAYDVVDSSKDDQASASGQALAPALGIDAETARSLDAAVREQTRRTREAAGLT